MFATLIINLYICNENQTIIILYMKKKEKNHIGFSNAITKTKLLIALLAMAIISVSCSDDDDNPTVDDNIVDELPAIKDDALKVTVASKTYIYNADYTSTAAALIKRITNIADRIDDTVETIIIHDSNIPTLTDQDYRDVITLVLHGGCVAYCSPTQGNADMFFRNLQRIGEQHHRIYRRGIGCIRQHYVQQSEHQRADDSPIVVDAHHKWRDMRHICIQGKRHIYCG